MANGKIIYPSGAEIQTTYTFIKNFDYGHQIGFIETDDHSRALDGTLCAYAGPRKKIYELNFFYVGKTQLDYFQNLWTYQCPIDLYLDGSTLDASVKMMAPPSGNSEKTVPVTYSFSVRFEEV
jgi:hypothetical protein